MESGTMGTKGHVQVIVPHVTESYTSQVGRLICFCFTVQQLFKKFNSLIYQQFVFKCDL